MWTKYNLNKGYKHTIQDTILVLLLYYLHTNATPALLGLRTASSLSCKSSGSASGITPTIGIASEGASGLYATFSTYDRQFSDGRTEHRVCPRLREIRFSQPRMHLQSAQDRDGVQLATPPHSKPTEESTYHQPNDM